MSLESLLASCWLLVIVIIVTIQHCPAIIPLLSDYTDAVMAIGSKKIFLIFLPVPLLVLFSLLWRYRRRYNYSTPLPPASSCNSKSDDVTEELAISTELVGFVIGRQGNKVKELEKQTGTKIRFREAKDGKVAMVTGQREDVEKAKEAIVIMLKERSEKKQVKSVNVAVPNFAIGRLIGKQGQNIGAMQKESGARIVVDGCRGSGTVRMCTISGTTEQVSRAVAMVQQSVSESEAAHQRNKLNRKLKSDNIHMKTAQMHHSKHNKGGQKELPSQQALVLKPATLPSNGDFFPAFVSNVSATGHVWIQPVNDRATLLDDLSSEMMGVYCNMDHTEHQLTDPSVNTYCSAKFSNDGQWYRAQVISTNSTAVHLLFIDYGDNEWQPFGDLKILLPQFCSVPIQACKCQLGGVAVPHGGWGEEATELIEDITMCAKWEPVMVQVTDHTANPPMVTIVNTSNNTDIDVASKLNALASQLPGQQEPVNEAVMVETSAQLESSVNMLDSMEEMLQQLDQSGNPDDQESNIVTNQSQDDQKLELIGETMVMETSSQPESSINTFDEALQQLDDHVDQQLEDHSVSQDNQHNKNSLTFTIQQRDQRCDPDDVIANQDDVTADERYEVQGVSVTFDTDSDDDDHVTVQVEEGGVITNESWLYSDDQNCSTESVSVTIAASDHTSKHVANCVSVTTPVL